MRRQVSLKALSYGKVEEAAKGTVRQHVALQAGISADHAWRINKIVKELNLRGVTSQSQGDQVRVFGKKRDDLQAVIARLKSGGPRHPDPVRQLPRTDPAHGPAGDRGPGPEPASQWKMSVVARAEVDERLGPDPEDDGHADAHGQPQCDRGLDDQSR